MFSALSSTWKAGQLSSIFRPLLTTWQHMHVGPAWDSVSLHSILSWIQKGLSKSLALDGKVPDFLVSIHTADISLIRNRTWFRPNVSPLQGACFICLKLVVGSAVVHEVRDSASSTCLCVPTLTVAVSTVSITAGGRGQQGHTDTASEPVAHSVMGPRIVVSGAGGTLKAGCRVWGGRATSAL